MACGQRLLRRQGFDVFQSNLCRGFYKGLEPRSLAETLNRHQPGWKGHYAFPTEEQIEGLAARGPHIARIGGNPGHFVVVESIIGVVVEIWDPDGGLARSLELGALAEVISGVVYR